MYIDYYKKSRSEPTQKNEYIIMNKWRLRQKTMKKIQGIILSISAIYLLIWAISGMFSPGVIILDSYLLPKGNIDTVKMYNGQKSSSRGLVTELKREELNSIIPNVINDSSFYKTGRQILCISKYTTGSNLLNFVPFLSFNDKYKIVSAKNFDKQIGIDNYSEYFNLFHMSDYSLAWILALFISSLLITTMLISTYFEKKNNVKGYKISSITGKIAGLIVFSKFYFNDDMYISVKVFLNNPLHLIFISILSMLITQIINIKKPLNEFKKV